jgi:decaprenylphospho-beta-D-erythro-pentofuranosid-2-ulose 2-reductase
MKQTLSMAKTVAIFGATSDIAAAVARRYSGMRSRLVLVGRDAAGLTAMAADLGVRGAAETHILRADFACLEDLPGVVSAAWDRFGGIDVALIAYGTLPSQQEAERDAVTTAQVMAVNFTSPAILLNELGRRFQVQGQGTIAAITSVAGDRGRSSNYVYGAAKGGLQRLLEGLRHRLAGSGIGVVDIRPGFVTTKMTAHLVRKGPLWASPDRVAADIVGAITASRAVRYSPRFWWLIMLIVRSMPRFVLHRTSF